MKKIIVFVHNHFDLVWLRRSAEYQEIQSDVLHKVLRLLDEYSDYTYAFGQAKITRDFLERYPHKKEEIINCAAKKQLELVCGTEAIIDTNLVTPESLIRNIILGLEWYKKSLGIEIKTGWLLDAFGLTPQIPQIMRNAGFEWMLGDRYAGRHIPPFHRWIGLDGTSILVGNASGGATFGMNGPVVPWEKTSEMFKSSISDMVKTADLALACIYSEEGLPSEYFRNLLIDVKREFPDVDISWGTPGDFFREIIRREKSKIHNIPEIKGDLPPFSTGCYATRIPVKLANREAENNLLNAEKLAAVSAILSGTVSSNTGKLLEKAWRLLLFNQFHDSICGCHTPQVTEEVMERYDEIRKISDHIIKKSILLSVKDNDQKSVWIFNPLPFKLRTVCAATASGALFNDPLLREDTVPIVINDAPPLAFSKFTQEKVKATIYKKEKKALKAVTLENKYYKLRLEDGKGLAGVRMTNGDIELMSKPGNVIHLREDTGHMWLESFSGAFTNSLEGKITITDVKESRDFSIVTLSGSIDTIPWSKNATLKFRQKIALYKDIPYIDFMLSLDWDGDNTQFQVRFPTGINVSYAHHNVPFGEILRNEYDAGKSLSNNSWANEDWPANQYFYINSEELNIGLINRGTCGASVRNGELRMTLMRTSTSMMAEGDKADSTLALRGSHIFRYALMAWKEKSPYPIQQAAQIYNCPMVFFKGKPVIADCPAVKEGRLVELISPGVVITCIKPAQNGDGVIIRGYESLGNKHECSMKFGLNCDVWRCNIMEENIRPIGSGLTSLTFGLSAFEIFTVKIRNVRLAGILESRSNSVWRK